MGLWNNIIDGYKVSKQLSKDAKAAEEAKKKPKVATPGDIDKGVGSISDNIKKKKAELQTN